jgi:L-lactate dehydrogenase complex protein LldE
LRTDRPDTVYFFGTCLLDLFYPRAGLAGMELLKNLDLRVIFPQEQTCCGQPAYNSGFREEARRVAARQIA